jgi:DNA-binding CsgD family transcriptional regulator
MANTLGPSSAQTACLELSYQLAGLPSRQDYLYAASALLFGLLPGDCLAWTAIETDAARAEVVPYPGDGRDPEHLASQLVAVADDHPMVVSYLGDGTDMSPRRLSDITTRTHLRNTRAYREFLHPLGTEHELSIVTGRVSATSARGWAMNRTTHDFTDAELELSRALQPALWLLDVTAGVSDRPSEAQRDVAGRYGLTVRELEVLRYLSTGLTVEAMGRQMRISGRTVRKHLDGTYRKLDCHDRLIAVTKARTAGLI